MFSGNIVRLALSLIPVSILHSIIDISRQPETPEQIESFASSPSPCTSPGLTQALELILESEYIELSSGKRNLLQADETSVDQYMFGAANKTEDNMDHQDKKPRSNDEDLFTKLTNWIDPQLQKQAAEHRAIVKAEVGPMLNQLTEIKTLQGQTNERVSKVESEQTNLRKELEAHKVETTQAISRALAGASSSSTPTGSPARYTASSSPHRSGYPSGSAPFPDFMAFRSNSSTVGAASESGIVDHNKFCFGTFSEGVPTEVSYDQLCEEAKKVEPPVVFSHWEARRPSTKYIFVWAKADLGRDGVQACWALANRMKKNELKPLVPEGAPPIIDRSGKPLIIWGKPAKHLNQGNSSGVISEAEADKRFVNMTRRFLHGVREQYNIGEDYLSYGKPLPIIGGSGTFDKHITWKSVRICTFSRLQKSPEQPWCLQVDWIESSLMSTLAKQKEIIEVEKNTNPEWEWSFAAFQTCWSNFLSKEKGKL